MNKICWVATHPIQYQAPLLRKIAKERGVDLSVLFFSDFSTKNYKDPEFNQKIEWDTPLLEGYKYKFLRGTGGRVSKIRTFSPWIFGLLSEFRKAKYDAVVVQGWNHYGMICAATYAKILGARVYLRCEATDHVSGSTGFKKLLREMLVKFLIKISDGMLYIGSMNKEFYLKRGVEESKLTFMPYVVDNKLMNSFSRGEVECLRSKFNANGKRVVLYASKFIKRKNPDLLIKAFISANIKNTLLIMVGNGELEGVLRELACDSDSNIKFAGFVNQSQIINYYALADVFVLPSVDETWGLVINEAMCSGTAIITTQKVGSAVDLVDGTNGIVLNTISVESISNALKEILNTQNLHTFKGRSIEIINNWNIDKAVSNFIGVLNE